MEQLRQSSKDAGRDARGTTAFRIGVSGPPGVGKSCFIEALGLQLVDRGHRVAVLAVDPSSTSTRGALLADKTRMTQLHAHPRAFVRPSASGGELGGARRTTAETITVVEAAGYDRVVVESVGVGQSEVHVAQITDCLLLLLPPVGGDHLQAAKKGIMEAADLVIVHKADGALREPALQSAAVLAGALRSIRPRWRATRAAAFACSALTGYNVAKLVDWLEEFRGAVEGSGELAQHRRRQIPRLLDAHLEHSLLELLRNSEAARCALATAAIRVDAGEASARAAAGAVLGALLDEICATRQLPDQRPCNSS